MSETATCIKFGEHGARVEIEDKEIPHYDMHVDPAKKEVSCWIPSEAGKAFSVVWLGLDVDYPTACYLHLDGHSVGRIRRQIDYVKLIRYESRRVSETSEVPFLFSPLVVTDDDTYLDTSPSHSIGEIKLAIVRTTIPKIIPKNIAKGEPIINLASQKVHERSKKAIAHQVNYGSETPIERKEAHSLKILETLVTFIFKYRPLEMLRANGIVPRNPQSPDIRLTSETSSLKGEHSKLKKEVGSGSETDDSDEDSMREKALLAEVQRCQAEVERIRVKKARGRHSKDSERPKKKMKKEDKPKPFFTPGEIIDLT